MAISKVVYKSSDSATPVVWMDTTDKTANNTNMLSGTTALKNDGTTATGTIASKTSSDLTASGATVTAPAGYYASDASKSVASGTEGTPTATKGTVANHSVTITPSVTNTAGYINGGTHAGSGVSVNVTELESGTKSITQNGTGISVSGYSTVDVAVPGGGSSTLIEKSITQNGTYNAVDDSADGYSSVTVNVSGGGSAVTVIDEPDSHGGTVKHIIAVDISNDTVTAAHLESGYTAHDAQGNAISGTLSPGGGGSVSPKQVNFIDYDGTVLYAYTAAEANALSALPANPSHSGLTAQGWNWTLPQIKAQLTAMPDAPVWVGQMYVTTSGKTEIDVRFTDSARLSPIMTIAVNGTITVDWGDDTTPDTVTGSSLTTRQAVPHTYANTGDYTILISVTSGSFTFYGSASYLLLRKNTTGNENRVYANCIQYIRLGNGITSLGSSTFYHCHSLASITIPSGVTSIESSAFQSCYSLASVTMPSGVTSIGGNAFQSCSSLASFTIPSGVTSIGNYAFQNCYSLASVTIPSGVTSIGNYAFEYCLSLASITIPSTVTSIGNSAFSSCLGMKEYHIKPTTVPTGGTSMFSSIVSDCIIYVPSAKLSDYKGASNWSTYASYMQGE